MRASEGAAEEPLVDTTVAIPLRSKRTERKQKKRQEKALKHRMSLLDLPSELVIEILGHLKPSDAIIMSRVSKNLRTFINENESSIALQIISLHYPALSKCFRLPVLLEMVDVEAHPILQNPERQEKLGFHKKPFQHVKPPDPQLVCTCWACILAWNNLCVVVDFTRWQTNLDAGDPIPIIPRGKHPGWNRNLVASNAAIVEKALRSLLWYARILEQHLRSIVRSIRRHANNKGNKRKRFRMCEADARAGSDAFLERSGPPTLDFPFHRDNFYMLEAYLPNRGWNAEEGRWMYLPALHDGDLERIKATAPVSAPTVKKVVMEERCKGLDVGRPVLPVPGV